MWHYTHFHIIPGIFTLNYSAGLSLFFPPLCYFTDGRIFFAEFILRIDMISDKNFAYLEYAVLSKYLTSSHGKTLAFYHP